MASGPEAHFAVFPTAIVACGLAWRREAIIAAQLPEASEAETRRRIAARAASTRESEPPAAIREAIAAVTSLLAGARVDLRPIPCDFGEIDDLRLRVYQAAREILAGETCTYGELAARLGDRRLAQAVGQALGRNPLPIIVPCHRVMGAGGRLTGFSANGGVETKLRLLAIEGASLGAGPGLFDELPLAVAPRKAAKPLG